ncbi:cell division protein ZapE [Rhodococcus sp. SGAir0479]|nr:cell division protein ZapE [Rhodococcus sp. SGAir0479]
MIESRSVKRPRQSRGPFQVPVQVFETRSGAEGFALDAVQRRAAGALTDVTGLGVYLWGPPGRGKTWLMDAYFAAVPTNDKVRLHFHEFFRALHTNLVRSRYDFPAAVDALLRRARVVCFDEFHVQDIGDARLLERLLPRLLDLGITVVATSNHPPDALLPDPLFHDAFVPTIALIERTMTVVSMDGDTDYRTTTTRHDSGFASGSWVVAGSPQQLRAIGLTRPGAHERRSLTPAGHPVNALRADSDCLWFTFDDLCGAATAPADYLSLARLHRSWVVSDVPGPDAVGREAAQRFVNLVDVLYDQDVTVTFLAHGDRDFLLGKDCPPADLARLGSRLRRLRTEAEAAAGDRHPADASAL